jgi:quinol monooxygenase YgiN
MRIGRYARSSALQGRGDALADGLLRAAALLEDAEGCELYVINRVPGDPDTVWVTEIWASREALDASLQLPGVPELIGEVLPLVDRESMELVELLPVGGLGLAPG